MFPAELRRWNCFGSAVPLRYRRGWSDLLILGIGSGFWRILWLLCCSRFAWSCYFLSSALVPIISCQEFMCVSCSMVHLFQRVARVSWLVLFAELLAFVWGLLWFVACDALCALGEAVRAAISVGYCGC